MVTACSIQGRKLPKRNFLLVRWSDIAATGLPLRANAPSTAR